MVSMQGHFELQRCEDIMNDSVLADMKPRPLFPKEANIENMDFAWPPYV